MHFLTLKVEVSCLAGCAEVSLLALFPPLPCAPLSHRMIHHQKTMETALAPPGGGGAPQEFCPRNAKHAARDSRKGGRVGIHISKSIILLKFSMVLVQGDVWRAAGALAGVGVGLLRNHGACHVVRVFS